MCVLSVRCEKFDDERNDKKFDDERNDEKFDDERNDEKFDDERNDEKFFNNAGPPGVSFFYNFLVIFYDYIIITFNDLFFTTKEISKKINFSFVQKVFSLFFVVF